MDAGPTAGGHPTGSGPESFFFLDQNWARTRRENASSLRAPARQSRIQYDRENEKTAEHSRAMTSCR
jgi:hypothetical protein